MKVVYDLRKRSNNQRLIQEGKYEELECVERCDSKIEEGDLERLEIELKKKQKKRLRNEVEQAIRPING